MCDYDGGYYDGGGYTEDIVHHDVVHHDVVHHDVIHDYYPHHVDYFAPHVDIFTPGIGIGVGEWRIIFLVYRVVYSTQYCTEVWWLSISGCSEYVYVYNMK